MKDPAYYGDTGQHLFVSSWDASGFLGWNINFKPTSATRPGALVRGDGRAPTVLPWRTARSVLCLMAGPSGITKNQHPDSSVSSMVRGPCGGKAVAADARLGPDRQDQHA